MTKLAQQLSTEIESAVERIVAASLATTLAAVEQAFQRSSQIANESVAARKDTAPSAAPRPKRTRQQIETLAESLFQMVDENPGETMSVLAPRLQQQAQELYLPVQLLKRQGRIRAIGLRQHTRYFPAGDTQ